MTIKDRWYQTEALQAFADFVSTHPSGRNPLIVMPTGTGKSVVIARIIQWVRQWNSNRVLVLTHIGELVKQNAHKLKEVWPEADIGVCSASLGQKDTEHDVVFATVQTVASMLKRNATALGRRCLIIIDECHLLSADSTSQYRTVLRLLREQCPQMRVCGLSATPYRTKDGLLTQQKEPIFTDIAYDLTTKFTELIAQGYLSPLVTPPVPVSINLQGVHMRGGDFKDDELQQAVGNEKLLQQACRIMALEGKERKAWLVFVSGIANAQKVTAMLQQLGIAACDVNSAHTPAENDQAIADFRAGKLRCLVSANQLTTGFDVPQVDLIGMLRPTMSTSLHTQMLGRGTRPAAGKSDCLVLDFAQNVARLGPINRPMLPTPKQRMPQLDDLTERAQTKRCGGCKRVIPINTRICPYCGYQSPQDLDVKDLSQSEVISYTRSRQLVKGSSMAQVRSMIVGPHQAASGRSCLRVGIDAISARGKFREWFYLCFDVDSKLASVRANANQLWQYLGGAYPPPQSTEEAVTRSPELKTPKEIEVLRSNRKRHYAQLVATYY